MGPSAVLITTRRGRWPNGSGRAAASPHYFDTNCSILKMANIIYGKNPVLEALTAGQPINKIFIASGISHAADNKIVQLARQRGIPVREADRRKLAALAGHAETQGVVALLTSQPYQEMVDIFRVAQQKNESPLIALLDEIQDPHNLGAIIRSAEAFGFHGIIVTKNHSVGLTDVVAKTSAGAVAHLPIVRVTNLVQTLQDLKARNIWLAGAAQEANVTVFETDLNRPLGIVIGSEGRGLRRLVKETCDFLVRIPMFGRVNSLNASVAAALIFCEARRQRAKL